MLDDLPAQFCFSPVKPGIAVAFLPAAFGQFYYRIKRRRIYGHTFNLNDKVVVVAVALRIKQVNVFIYKAFSHSGDIRHLSDVHSVFRFVVIPILYG